jgi:hypothetical protein
LYEEYAQLIFTSLSFSDFWLLLLMDIVETLEKGTSGVHETFETHALQARRPERPTHNSENSFISSSSSSLHNINDNSFKDPISTNVSFANDDRQRTQDDSSRIVNDQVMSDNGIIVIEDDIEDDIDMSDISYVNDSNTEADSFTRNENYWKPISNRGNDNVVVAEHVPLRPPRLSSNATIPLSNNLSSQSNVDQTPVKGNRGKGGKGGSKGNPNQIFVPDMDKEAWAAFEYEARALEREIAEQLEVDRANGVSYNRDSDVVIVLDKELTFTPPNKSLLAFFEALLPGYKGSFSLYVAVNRYVNFRVNRGVDVSLFFDTMDAAKKDISSFFQRNLRLVRPRRKHASITLLLPQVASIDMMKQLIFVSLKVPFLNLKEIQMFANDNGLTGLVVLEYSCIPTFFVKLTRPNGNQEIGHISGVSRWFMSYCGPKKACVDQCRGCGGTGHSKDECRFDVVSRTFKDGPISHNWASYDDVPLIIMKQSRAWAYEDEEVIPPFSKSSFGKTFIPEVKVIPMEVFMSGMSVGAKGHSHGSPADLNEDDFESMSRSMMDVSSTNNPNLTLSGISVNASSVSHTQPPSNSGSINSPSSSSTSSSLSNDRGAGPRYVASPQDMLPSGVNPHGVPGNELIDITWATYVVIRGERQVRCTPNPSPIQIELISFMWTGDYNAKTFDAISQDVFEKSYVSLRSSHLLQWLADYGHLFKPLATSEYERLHHIWKCDIRDRSLELQRYYELYEPTPLERIVKIEASPSTSKKRKILTGEEEIVDLIDVDSSSSTANGVGCLNSDGSIDLSSDQQ